MMMYRFQTFFTQGKQWLLYELLSQVYILPQLDTIRQ